MAGVGAGGGVRSIALLGSGAFALPTFEALLVAQEQLGVRIACVVTQPDRPAGRGRGSQPTPVGQWAAQRSLTLHKLEDVNAPEARTQVGVGALDLFVVIAFGQKLSEEFLGSTTAINLHGSLLPAWRGAAPIQRALMAGDVEVGVSVIGVASRMDAGRIFAQARARVGEAESAGELHDRLAVLGAPVMLDVIGRLGTGAIGAADGSSQDEAQVTRARKLSRQDAWVDFRQSAHLVRARINGLCPWPGVDALIEGRAVKLLRACKVEVGSPGGEIGVIGPDGIVRCGEGCVAILQVQEAGGRVVTWEEFARGRRISHPQRLSCPMAQRPEGS